MGSSRSCTISLSVVVISIVDVGTVLVEDGVIDFGSTGVKKPKFLKLKINFLIFINFLLFLN
jgi:hypothetical protein